jgi:polysaccharide biosynthesis/export protein
MDLQVGAGPRRRHDARCELRLKGAHQLRRAHNFVGETLMNANSVIRFVIASGLSLPLPAFQQPAGPLNVPGAYVLGPNDQLTIDVVELPEFHGRTYRVDSDGTIDVPLVGNIRAAGLTLSQFKGELNSRLRSQVRNPHVSASVTETKSQPVSVMGEVNKPGTQDMDGSKTLFDVLAGAGGLKQDAGDMITVKRQNGQGALGLPNAVSDPAAGTITADVKVRDLVELRDPAVNVLMRPHDEVFVSRSRLLYVIGDVRKPGGFTLAEKRSLSALEALSLAEGLAPNAAPKSARILRRTGSSDTARQQIPVDLKKILAGKAEDVTLLPDDILFVPDNSSRRIVTKTAETALATISGVVIWRGF